MANGRQAGSLVPSQVLAVISHTATGVTHVVEGYADDTAIDIERGEAAWTHSVGTDGFVSLCSITLMKQLWLQYT